MIEVGRVGMIPIDSIIVSGRTREVMGDLNGLEGSLKESGLTTPLTFKDNKDGTFKLLAGGRRFEILKRNSVKEIPARIYDRDLSDLEMKMIEKAENFFRKDMEYWEMDKLTLEIHQMKQSIHGAKGPGPTSGGHSLKDTGEMIGVSSQSVSQSLKRASAREQFPELFEGCKTASDATKLMSKIDNIIVRSELAEKAKAEGLETGIMQLGKNFVLKSFFEGVKEIPSGIMNFVEIDPPFSIDLHKTKKSEGESQYVLQAYDEIPQEFYMDGDPNGEWQGMNQAFRECYRVMADDSWLVCWFGPEPWFNDIYQAIIKAGFKTTRMCGLWIKPTGQTKQPDYKMPNSYEMFFYAWKGRPKLAKHRASNTFTYSPISPQNKTHPTEKPIALMTDIYETFAMPGDRILIPFLGSGNGLISAYNLSMSAIGFETGKSHKDSFLVKIHKMNKEG